MGQPGDGGIDQALAGQLLAASVDAFTLHDALGTYLYVSPSLEELTGFERADLVGHTPFELELFHAEDVDGIVEVQAKALATRDPWRVAYRLRRVDGAYLWVESAGRVIASDRGEDRFAVWTRDVGRLESLIKGLEHERGMKARLDRLASQQRAFLTAISHRARTPMTTVLGMSQLLNQLGDRLDDQQRTELTQRLVANAERLAELLQSVTEADHLSRAAVTLDRRVLDLRELVDDVLTAVAVGDAVTVDVPRGLRVVADEKRLKRVLQLLVTNAFTHGGVGVRVRISATRDDDGVVLTVADDGPGVAPADRRRIFEAFERGDPDTADPGAGVGLYLVSEIAALHGGRAWVESSPEGGAAFNVQLPNSERLQRIMLERNEPQPPNRMWQPQPQASTGNFLTADAQPFVTTLLDTIREEADMDVAYLSVFDDSDQIVLATAGDGARIGITAGTRVPLAETYCVRMVTEELDRIVRDARAHPAVAHLPATKGGVACYVGVPVHLPNGHLFGSLCCAHSEPRPDLTADVLDVLTTFARALGDQVHHTGFVDRNMLQTTSRVVELLSDPTDLTVVFQPIIELARGRIVGFESLARFADGRPPGLWFAEATRAGLLEELELLAARRALARLGDVPSDCYLSINLAPQTIAGGGIESLFEGQELARVAVEVTEHAAIQDYDEVVAVLEPLLARGLRVAVDDVGAGYASLQHVLRLQPDIIKVDRTFVATSAPSVSHRAVLAALTQLAHELGADLVAEAVDTEAALQAVTAAGFTHVQGNLFAAPDPAIPRSRRI